MGTNDPFDNEASTAGPFKNLLKTAVGLSPIGLAGFAGFRKIQANAALNPASAFHGGKLGRTGQAIGKRVAKAVDSSHQERLANAQKLLTEDLLGDGNLTQIFSVIEERNALLQSLSNTLDDPEALGDTATLQSYREQINDLIITGSGDSEAEDVVRALVKSVTETGSESARLRFASNLREFRGVSPNLMTPQGPYNGPEALVRVEQSGLTDRARRNLDFFTDRFSEDNKYKAMRQMEFYEKGGAQYARIMSPTGRAHYGTMPLDLGDPSPMTGASRISPRPVDVFMNESLSTLYAGNRGAVDAKTAYDFLKSKGGGQGVSLAQLASHRGAVGSTERFMIDQMAGGLRMDANGLFVQGNRNILGAQRRQYMTVQNRIVSTGDTFAAQSAGMVGHMRGATSFSQNYMTVGGMRNLDAAKQTELMQWLSNVGGLEVGMSASRISSRGVGGESFGNIGVFQGSALQALQTTGIAAARGNQFQARGYAPMTSRIEQVTGRQDAFVGSGTRGTFGRGGVMPAGPSGRLTPSGDVSFDTQRNLEWSSRVTGGTNRAILLDVSGTNLPGLAGSGAALHSAPETIRQAFTKPILVPGKGTYSSDFFEYLRSAGADKRMVKFTRTAGGQWQGPSGQQFSNFLGIGPTGLQNLRDDPRATSMMLGYNITDVGGKQHANIMGFTDRSVESFKAFSMLHKGQVQMTAESKVMSLANQMGLTPQMMQEMGLDRSNLVLASGDMLKKGGANIDVQLTSGFGMVTGRGDYREALVKGARGFLGAGKGKADMLKATTRAAMGLMAGNVGADEMGMVLAGSYYHGARVAGVADDAWKAQFGDWLTGAGLNPEASSAVMRSMQRGVAIGATVMSKGAGVGDWGLGRGGVEPRFFSLMQQHLRAMGMGDNEVGDVLSSIYKNKLGYQQHIGVATEMLEMSKTFSGLTSAADFAAAQKAGIPTYNLQDLLNNPAALDRGDFGEFISNQKQGFWLDMTQGPGTESARRVAGAAQDAFGQGQVYIPGGNVVSMMRDTYLKAGDDTIRISDEYTRMMSNFLADVSVGASSTSRSRAELAKAFGGWREDILNATMSAYGGVTRGKVRGLQAMDAMIYDLKTGSTFSEGGLYAGSKGAKALDRFEAAKLLTRRAFGRGEAVFMDTQGFMSMLNDFMGKNPDGAVRRDAADKAADYFLSLEARTAQGLGKTARGVTSFGMRHPLISTGNIASTQIFRHVEEVRAGMGDVALRKFLRTPRGKRYLADSTFKGFETVRGWNKLKKASFFRDFIEELPGFAGEGGGIAYTPRLELDVHYGKGRRAAVDFGISGAAIGDWDGDKWHFMMTSKRAGEKIRSTMSKKDARDFYGKRLVDYRIKAAVIAEEAKAGLGNLGKGITRDMYAQIREDLAKEAAGKQAIGSLDNRLTILRNSLMDLDMDSASMSKIEDAMAMLSATQEHATIKAKKLAIFKPFAENYGRAIDQLVKTGNADELSSFLKREIFHESQLAQGAVEIRGSGGVAGAYGEALDAMSGSRIDLDEIIGTIQNAVRVSSTRRSGSMAMGPAASMGREMGRDAVTAERLFADIQAMQTMEGGILHGGRATGTNVASSIAEKTSRMFSSIKGVGAKGMGLAVVGAAGAMALGGIVGGEGYAPRPLTAKGEIVPPMVRNAIASGNLFAQQGSGVDPSQLGSLRDNYQMMDRPLNTPRSYMTRPNSYQIRGQMGSMQQAGSMSNYLQSLGGGRMAGSMRINDTRPAITSNYIDRLLGEY